MAKDPEKSIFDNSIQYFTIITTVIVSVILLTLTLPPPNSVSLSSYSDGEVWGRKALIADEAFPLYKSEAEIKAQKDSIKKHFKPYFKINVSQVDTSLAIVSSKAKDEQFAQFPPAYINYIKEGIKEVYNRGIVPANELNEARSKGQTEINVALDKESNLYDIDSLFTPQAAYEYVMNRDSAHFKREILNAIFSEFDRDNSTLITPNIVLNAEMSASQLNSRLAEVGETKSSVKKGEKIIDYGEVIDAEKKVRIDSYVRMINEKNLSSKEGQVELLVGRALFFLGLLLALGVFLYIFRRDILRNKRSVMLIFTLVTIFPLITHLLLLFQMLNVYLLPFAMVAIFMCIFFDARTAFMALLTTILISSLGLSNPYEFVLIEVVAGLTAIFTVSELTERSELLKITLYITIVSLVFSLVFDLAQGRQIHELQGAHYQYITGGGIMILCSYPLLYLLERVFGFNSQMTLIELMNINNDILSQLSQNAQGTFNHSMNVANLATDVAKKIGAKVQLVRCGAFYHDIGKMANPTFFTENQMGVNPHDAIADEKESAIIIINH
ncbi:MAG: HDIG domain-containing protein, partial [Bacteroidaceae bacterium]|nr:HDIG domain-containing protein [Bacteroidaceae bacterium]